MDGGKDRDGLNGRFGGMVVTMYGDGIALGYRFGVCVLRHTRCFASVSCYSVLVVGVLGTRIQIVSPTV